jgi:hypothetical protein
MLRMFASSADVAALGEVGEGHHLLGLHAHGLPGGGGRKPGHVERAHGGQARRERLGLAGGHLRDGRLEPARGGFRHGGHRVERAEAGRGMRHA